jgi:uridylate kinase
MNYSFKKTVVVALGGSIVYPGTEQNGIDVAFLREFKIFLMPFVRRGTRFVLVVGGGKLARRFQEAAHGVSKLTDEDKDWIGIHATRLNGHLLRTIFRDVADPVMIDVRGRLKKLAYPVTIASGWRPGWSTDYVAIQLAIDFGVREVVIAGKPSHVFDRDPAKAAMHGKRGERLSARATKSPKAFDAITWSAYRKLIPRKWTPGLGAPVDPVGAALSERAGIHAIIVGGRNLANFAALLKGKEFQGTING